MFRTKIDINTNFPEINYNSNIFFFGSCFTENIGNIFVNSGFTTKINPFGIMYNPASIYKNIRILIDNKEFTDNDLDFYNNLWFSYNHHSKFSNLNKNVCLKNINDGITQSIKHLKKTDFIFFTFGTAWVYKLIKKNEIVANCHKQPNNKFNRYRLTIKEITDLYNNLINSLKAINSDIKIIFTVSPVRHLKDGANENQLSKSTLLLAIDNILKNNKNTYYFPSYELIIDELRDYRFYNDDMIHISNIAINYIWDKIKDTFFTPKTKQICSQINKINKASNHKPFNEESNDYQIFLQQNIKKINIIEKEYEINLQYLKQKFIKS